MYNDKTPSGRKSMNHGHTKGELTTKNAILYFLQIYCCYLEHNYTELT